MYSRPQSYLLDNQVTHARLLPAESANAFIYQTFSLLVSLNALENRTLDIGRGWIFGYGGRWCRLSGLRSVPYLNRQPGTIRDKLEAILTIRGFADDKHALQDAWMMTMPNFLGVEGINPLTVYFCYDSNGEFWLTVLEIHNTFGESHVHILEVGRNEDERPSNGYDHQWTFRREFHVSPFNDRSGFYTVSIKSPSHPPTLTHILKSLETPPRPAVRVHLYTACEDDATKPGVLKLTALLRPTKATPLTTTSLLWAIAQAPLGWLLTFSRILKVAWKLHYQKRLDVFIRPEPLPVTGDWGKPKPAGGVKWLEDGVLERFCRHRVKQYLRRRAEETTIEITLQPADPNAQLQTFSPTRPPKSSLVISYLSSRLFTILFSSPSAKHALLLGCDTERIFRVSSRDLFLSVFSDPQTSVTPDYLQRLRCRDIPPSLGITIPVPATHYLDTSASSRTIILSVLATYTIFFLDLLEKSVFKLARARIVEGQEPWKQWERAAAVFTGESPPKRSGTIGSVLRE